MKAIQLLLGHTKIESTARYLGIEVDDARAERSALPGLQLPRGAKPNSYCFGQRQSLREGGRDVINYLEGGSASRPPRSVGAVVGTSKV